MCIFSGQIPPHHFGDILPALPDLADHGRFETTVHHVHWDAAGVLLHPVLLPVGLFHHLPVGGVVGVGDQVAGGLPAAGITGGIAPRRGEG